MENKGFWYRLTGKIPYIARRRRNAEEWRTLHDRLHNEFDDSPRRYSLRPMTYSDIARKPIVARQLSPAVQSTETATLAPDVIQATMFQQALLQSMPYNSFPDENPGRITSGGGGDFGGGGATADWSPSPSCDSSSSDSSSSDSSSCSSDSSSSSSSD